MRRTLFTLALVLVGCGTASHGEEAPEAGAASPSAVVQGATLAPPIDLSAYVERARLSFYERDGRLEGGDLHYRATLDEAGLTFTAAHAPPDTPERRTRLALAAPVLLRDGEAIESPPGVPRRAADGGAVVERGWAREELVNRPEGVEQRWHFERPPPGDGALTLRIEAPSLALLRADEAGVHLAPAPGELGLVYGHGTWIDAHDSRTAVEARWVDGAIELEVPADVVARTRWPAVLDPVIGPEVGPGSSTYVAAPGTQGGSRIAVSPTGGALVVWRDTRRGVADVLATRLPLGGMAPVDPVGLVMNEPGRTGALDSAVAFGGGAYFVVWTQADRVLGRRVTLSGAYVDTTPILVREGPGVSEVEVAFDGTDFVVAWNEGPTGNLDLFAARVSPEGVLRDPPLVVSAATGSQTGLAIAAAGGTTQLVWTDARDDVGDVYAARIAGGVVLDPGGVPLATGSGTQNGPRVSIGAGTTLVAWQEPDLGVIRTSILGADGRPDGAPRLAASGGAFVPVLGGYVDGHFLAWREAGSTSSTYYAMHLSSTGGSASGPYELMRGSGGPEAASFEGGNFLVTMTSSSGLQATRVSRLGTTRSPERLTSGAQPHVTGRIAESAGQYLMVWSVYRGSWEDHDVFGMRIDATGAVLDATPLSIAIEDDFQGTPDVAGDGGAAGW